MEQTLIVIKPDALQRGLAGEIVHRFEKIGLKIVACKMFVPSEELLNKHYPVDREEFILGMANKTLENCLELGIDVKKTFGSDDPSKIGLQLQKWLVVIMIS